MHKEDIHPNVWKQLSIVQQLEIMKRTEPKVYKEDANYFISRGNIITSPLCPTESKAKEYDVMSMQNLEDAANLYIQQNNKEKQ